MIKYWIAIAVILSLCFLQGHQSVLTVQQQVPKLSYVGGCQYWTSLGAQALACTNPPIAGSISMTVGITFNTVPGAALFGEQRCRQEGDKLLARTAGSRFA